jgi:hypothetical protein
MTKGLDLFISDTGIYALLSDNNKSLTVGFQRFVAFWDSLARGPRRLAGVAGFEPTNGGIKSRCLTTWRHPSVSSEARL